MASSCCPLCPLLLLLDSAAATISRCMLLLHIHAVLQLPDQSHYSLVASWSPDKGCQTHNKHVDAAGRNRQVKHMLKEGQGQQHNLAEAELQGCMLE